MTTYLVAGADRVDAGKTTFTLGLLSFLDATGFKPRAGNDYWFHHDDYRRAVDDGRLYGGDARKIAAASADGAAPEDLNAVHRLWMPAPDGDGFIGPPDRTWVLDRVGDGFVLNANATVPDSAAAALPLTDAPRVETVEDLNRLTADRYLPRLRALEERIAATPTAVVESYGDIARPLRDLVPDRVAVVEPGRARIYDGQRYVDACAVAPQSPVGGRIEERVGDIVDLIEPDAVASLPPLLDDERADPARIAGAYADAYEPLCAGG